MHTHKNLYSYLCSYENLLQAFLKAKKHKTQKQYVLDFQNNLKENLLQLQADLIFHSYNPEPLKTFILRDPKTYRREIIWRRSFNKNLKTYQLNEDEIKILNSLGVSYDLKNIGTYTTQKNIEKTRLQIRLSKKENLLRLYKLITIPDNKKQELFNQMISSIDRKSFKCNIF